VKGRLRLIRHEMALTMAALEEENLTADAVLAAIDRNTIKDDQWRAGQAVLSEALTQEQWVSLSSPYLCVQLLIGGGYKNEELLPLAQQTLHLLRRADGVVWALDPKGQNQMSLSA
jgi:hypothetical protein